MSTPSLSQDFERAARSAAVNIAQKFIDVAKAKQYKTWTMSSVAMLCAFGPFAAGLVSPWPLALILPPIIMAKAMYDTHLKQKEMQDSFKAAMENVPAEARGIVNSELDTMEKTIKSFRTGLSKKDFLPKDDKRAIEMAASAILLMPPLTVLAIPSFFYLLLRKESSKTTDMINQADAVIERNRPPAP